MDTGFSYARILFFIFSHILLFQSSQPLPSILDFRCPYVGVFPEGEEFLEVFDS